MDLVVKYTLFNIGDVAAVDVSLTEHGFGMDDFDIVGGQSAVKIDRLAGGANTTHALVLRPKKFGYFKIRRHLWNNPKTCPNGSRDVI